MARIVSTRFLVEGVNDDADTRKAMQRLFDIFTFHGLGQATFEIVPGEPTRLWIKHKEGRTPSQELIAEALSRAGDYRVIDGGTAQRPHRARTSCDAQGGRPADRR